MNKDEERGFALEVVQQLRAAGYEALWAGGCVRDLCMGKAPSDYDVATSATPQQVRVVFGKRRTLPVGVAFGVVIVLAPRPGASQVEVATFRTDGGYSDGRHPDAVVFSTAQEDAKRRDFTINGMFYDPESNEIIDYVGGEDDIRAGLIRAIGKADHRLSEDKLRMLRAIRFAAKFGFRIESDTRSAVARHASEITLVSGERIYSELRKTLETTRADWAIREWYEVGLLKYILPELAALGDTERERAARALTACGPGDWLHKLCVSLWFAVKEDPTAVAPVVLSLRSRLKLANEESDAIGFCLQVQNLLRHSETKRWSSVQPVLANKHARQAVAVFGAIANGIESGHESLRHTHEWLVGQLSLPQKKLNPEPLLNGADLIACGLPPNPQFQQILGQARALQLDGILLDRRAALDWLAGNVSR